MRWCRVTFLLERADYNSALSLYRLCYHESSHRLSKMYFQSGLKDILNRRLTHHDDKFRLAHECMITSCDNML